MQIALIYDAVYPFVAGGVERRNYAVAETLRHNHGVALYGFDYWGDGGEGRLAGCSYVGVGSPIALYDNRGQRKISEAIRFAGRLFAALLHSRHDVWDVANFPFFSVPAAWLASRIRGRKLIVTWYEFWGDYWYQYLGWRGIFGRGVERLALRCSPRVITISELTKQRLIAAGYPNDRITLVPCGVDLKTIVDAPAATESHDLIYVGRLLPHKRVELAIQALERLRRTRPGSTMAIVGDGPEHDRLRRLTAELGLESAVRFYGKLPHASQVYGLLKSSRVLVSPSEREGFGIAVVEGWACGLPAVVCAGRDNAMCELIDRQFKGRIADRTTDGIAAACRELLAEPPGSQRQDRQAAAASYDWPRIARRLESVYQTLVAE